MFSILLKTCCETCKQNATKTYVLPFLPPCKLLAPVGLRICRHIQSRMRYRLNIPNCFWNLLTLHWYWLRLCMDQLCHLLTDHCLSQHWLTIHLHWETQPYDFNNSLIQVSPDFFFIWISLCDISVIFTYLDISKKTLLDFYSVYRKTLFFSVLSLVWHLLFCDMFGYVTLSLSKWQIKP